MKNFRKQLIKQDLVIIDAMKKLTKISESLTLFVLDDQEKMIGTLTDGDIRRGFIDGLTLDDSVSSFMSKQFYSLKSDFTIADFKKSRDKGIKLLPLLDEKKRIIKIYDLKKRKSILPLECMIMAGGRGIRLRPLTDNKPKPMLPLFGKPILEHNIDRLISFGIENIYISIGYLGQQIIDYFGDGSSKGISIKYIWDEKPLGTAGALSLVKTFETDYVLVMNSDLFTDADFEDLYMNIIDKKASFGAASIAHNFNVPLGVFSEKDKYINGLKEKPTFTNHANAGIYIFKKELIKLIPENIFYNITDLMNLLIENKEIVIHNPIVGYWIDIGQPQDYANAIEIAKHIKSSK